MKKIMNISHNKYHFECKYAEGAINPYRLYRVEWKWHENGRAYESKKLINKFADFQSVLYQVAGYIR